MAESAEIRDSIFSKIFERLEKSDAANSDRDKMLEKMITEVHDLAVAVNRMSVDLHALILTLRGLGATANLMGDDRRNG